MPRPKHKEIYRELNKDIKQGNDMVFGYNQACDAWESYLQSDEFLSEKELAKYLYNHDKKEFAELPEWEKLAVDKAKDYYNGLAKAILQHIRGKIEG